METINEKIQTKLKLLTAKPGVYLMKNRSGKIIYVGKAKVLKNRVRSYFTGTPSDEKTRELVTKIVDFDYIITTTEKEALLLEDNLIKKYKPRYNIMLKDDKHYPFIAVSVQEPFPRIFVTRDLKKDGSRYFGPYIDTRAVRRTTRLLEWIFPFRTCKRMIPKDTIVFKKACINYQLGKCPAPCVGRISFEDYRDNINLIIEFLNGKNQRVIRALEKEMKLKSKAMEYEKAASLRDKILDIQKLNNKRSVFFTDQKNRDVIGIYTESENAVVSVLKLVEGRLLNKELYEMENVGKSSPSEIISAFVKQYYLKVDSVIPVKLPNQILLQVKPDDLSMLNSMLENRLHVPQRGDMKQLITIAAENAFNKLEENKLKHLRKSNRTIFPVTDLKEKLNLRALPRKMICIDISTIQGTDTVSSLVYFKNGKPFKKNYRNFIIKTLSGQDDFAAMAETMERYFMKVSDEDRPDLIVIDGGKGQLNSASGILNNLTIENIEIISLAKRLEEVFIPGYENSVILPRSSSALRLLVHIRDEAHRFAITFHRKRRSSRTLTSELDSIQGVGEELKFYLLKEFGSVEAIKKASISELTKIKGIAKKTAEKIVSHLE